jgi:hypothetical protein
MPFTKYATRVIGRRLSVAPEAGYGWALIGEVKILEELQVPGAFQAELIDVLFDGPEARALICKVSCEISGRLFNWGAFIPRTTLNVDLRRRSVGCNILLATTKPYISRANKFPDPDHVRTRSSSHVRGFGRISMLEGPG